MTIEQFPEYTAAQVSETLDRVRRLETKLSNVSKALGIDPTRRYSGDRLTVVAMLGKNVIATSGDVTLREVMTTMIDAGRTEGDLYLGNRKIGVIHLGD